ncbi:putative WRKY transcription factor 35 [Hordeum vulgare]|nr:putative WRKY transcription factor 35 [Hordeum vulgare]
MLGRRTCSVDIVINEPDTYSCLVKPKTEPGLLPVKEEHLALAIDDETALKWEWDDHAREEMERQSRALEEIAVRRPGCEGGGVILEDSDEEATGPSNPVRHDDPGQGCSKDDGGTQDDDDDDDDGDYTNFYKLLGMLKSATSGDGDVV